MALSTYAELQTSIASWLHRPDLTSVIPDFITIAERWIIRRVVASELETALSTVIASGVAPLPSDFVSLRNARLSTTPSTPLTIRPAEWIYSNYPNRSGGAVPQYIAVEGSNFIFGPYPSAYTVVGTYYKDPGPLSVAVNSLFTNNPDLYLYAALCAAEPYLKNDPRLVTWMTQRDAILEDVNQDSESSRWGDGMSVMNA